MAAPMLHGPLIERSGVENISIEDLSKIDNPHTIYVRPSPYVYTPPCLYDG
jgi:hypothetical protein